MNFIAAAGAPDGRVSVAGAHLSPATRTRVTGPITLGVRPEYLILGASGEESLPAVTEFSEYLGGTRFLYARLADGQSIVAEHRDGPDVRAAETIHMRCPPERMRLFSNAGDRLR